MTSDFKTYFEDFKNPSMVAAATSHAMVSLSSIIAVRLFHKIMFPYRELFLLKCALSNYKSDFKHYNSFPFQL